MSDFDRLDSVLKAYQASFIGKVYNEENDDHDLLMDASVSLQLSSGKIANTGGASWDTAGNVW